MNYANYVKQRDTLQVKLTQSVHELPILGNVKDHDRGAMEITAIA